MMVQYRKFPKRNKIKHPFRPKQQYSKEQLEMTTSTKAKIKPNKDLLVEDVEIAQIQREKSLKSNRFSIWLRFRQIMSTLKR